MYSSTGNKLSQMDCCLSRLPLLASFIVLVVPWQSIERMSTYYERLMEIELLLYIDDQKTLKGARSILLINN